ncbi:hypothetical protein AMS68_000355 [Peltaster fructicola]|uniref:DNA recombination and repair protein Rad51-like C-terminal domain-containing protein n=1 Tax=Peltaster fructicola TaxID=286661 RepID=A0A6H0XJM7_9PEZI|nr:hypothetical protein AMS68_000355 [Peltaster fructicola]
MAEAFGRRLLADVEVIGFDELLNSLKLSRESSPRWFNCAQIDDILQHVTARSKAPPVLEFTSIGAGGGKTHLLYLLASLAVLPTQYGGRSGCVVVVDADGNFSVARLAQQIRHRLSTWASNKDKTTINTIIRSALYHVYIYKPQSMRDLVEILAELPTYFLRHNHNSLDRCMSLIAIDSASAFYWQTRAEEETAAFTASMQSSATPEGPTERAVTYADLRNVIESASKALQCPVVMTSRHIGRLPRSMAGELPRVLRPCLSPPLAQLPTLRFIVRRVPVKKIPSGLNPEEMLREHADQMKIVAMARFECFVDEFPLNIRDVQTLRATQDGFYFRIKSEGVIMETALVEAENEV